MGLTQVECGRSDLLAERPWGKYLASLCRLPRLYNGGNRAAASRDCGEDSLT